VHAAGDVWAHTLVNQYAQGVWPPFAEIPTSTAKAAIALRHVLIEGYFDRHTPGTDWTIDAPTGFIYSTFIDNAKAASMNRGPFIEFFSGLHTRLAKDRDTFAYEATHASKCLVRVNNKCQASVPDLTVRAVAAAKKTYLDAWIGNIVLGLQKYPGLSLKLARDLFTRERMDFGAATSDATQYINLYMLAMVGVPESVGQTLEKIRNALDWIAQELGFVTKDIQEAQARLLRWLIRQGFGCDINDVKKAMYNPGSYIKGLNINCGTQTLPTPLFTPGTSATLDQLMGLSVDGVTFPDVKYDPNRFAAMRDTIALSAMTLLDARGLNVLLANYGLPPHYRESTLRDPRGLTLPANMMLDAGGWIRCIDCNHQWRKYSTRDGHRYGEGNFFIWQNCAARDRVFRVIFRDWENGSQNFPDLGDSCQP
jgi:hypothetical protein